MLRRAGPPVLLLALGLLSGVLAARLPPDFETMVVTRRHHGADPLLSAALLRFGVDSLLHHPSRYFQPPILFPDPNPLRGTEPLVAEALLALPFRLALGDRPAAVYTSVKIFTLALLTLGTGLLLRELGVRLCSVPARGRAQPCSCRRPWCSRTASRPCPCSGCRSRSSSRFAPGAADGRARRRPSPSCLFLTVQASLYTGVMLLAVAPFLAPLLLALRREEHAGRRAAGLALGAAAAGALCLVVLRPYLADRADVATYSTTAYASEKGWNAAMLGYPLTSPPEYGLPGWRLGPASSWDGMYPGTGFVAPRGRPGRARAHGRAPGPRARRPAAVPSASRLGAAPARAARRAGRQR